MFAYRFVVRILIAASLFAASTVDVHAYMGPCEALGVCDEGEAPNTDVSPTVVVQPDPTPVSDAAPMLRRARVESPTINIPSAHAAAPKAPSQPTITHNSAPLPASGMGMTEIAVLAIIVLIAASYRFSRFSHQKS